MTVSILFGSYNIRYDTIPLQYIIQCRPDLAAELTAPAWTPGLSQLAVYRTLWRAHHGNVLPIQQS